MVTVWAPKNEVLSTFVARSLSVRCPFVVRSLNEQRTNNERTSNGQRTNNGETYPCFFGGVTK